MKYYDETTLGRIFITNELIKLKKSNILKIQHPNNTNKSK